MVAREREDTEKKKKDADKKKKKTVADTIAALTVAQQPVGD